MNTTLKKWKTVRSRQILRNKYYNVYEDTVLLPNGARYRYFVNNPRGRAALVLPFDGRGRILISREFRYPVGRVIYDMIGGSVDHGESPLDAAKRELEEEAGYRAKRWERIGRVYGNPSRSGTVFYFYAAYQLTDGMKKHDVAEMTENAWLPRKRFEGMIQRGEIMDPYLLAAYLIYTLKHRKHGHR